MYRATMEDHGEWGWHCEKSTPVEAVFFVRAGLGVDDEIRETMLRQAYSCNDLVINEKRVFQHNIRNVTWTLTIRRVYQPEGKCLL